MSGIVDWNVLIFVVTVFGGGATLAWFFSSIIAKQSREFNDKIDETSKNLEHRIEGLDIIAKADRTAIGAKLESFDERDRHEHHEMLEQITQVRIAIGQLETKAPRQARTKKKS